MIEAVPGKAIAASPAVSIMAAFGAVLCWGSGPVMSKWALGFSGPLFLLVVQLSASVLFLLSVVIVLRKKIALSKGLAKSGLTGVFEPTLGYGLGNIGLTTTSASAATLISTSEMPLVCLIMWGLFRVRPNGFTAAAVVAVGVGIYLVVQPSLIEESLEGAFAGNMFVLAGALAAALYVTLSSRLVSAADPLDLVIAQQLVGLILAALWFAAAIIAGSEPIPNWNGLGWLMFAAVSGIVEFGPPFWLFLIAMRGLSSNAVSVIITLVPVVALLEANLFLGETMYGIQWIGSGLVIGAAFIAKRT